MRKETGIKTISRLKATSENSNSIFAFIWCAIYMCVKGNTARQDVDQRANAKRREVKGRAAKAD